MVSSFRLGLSMGFSKLEFLGQIASFERRLRGAVPTPVALPYPFRTWTGSSMGAERDKREVAKMLYFEEVLSSLRLDLDASADTERIISWDNISKLA